MARRVPSSIYRHPLITQLRRTINRHSLLLSKQKVLVGLSGGADSVALLLALSKLGYECIALHCNFHLRGEESNEDQSFCQDLCQRHAIPLLLYSFRTEEYAQEQKISIEMAARNLRYSAFQEAAEIHSVPSVAVAHHLKDNVETLLGNVALGTGIKGLKGMPIRRENIVRPLLETDPKEIYSFLRLLQEDYRTDCTNRDTTIRRNYIRHSIIPPFEHLNPNFLATAHRLIEHLREAEYLYARGYEMVLQAARLSDHHSPTEEYLLSPIVSSQASLSILHGLLADKGFCRNELEKFALHLSDQEPATIHSSTHQVTRAFGKLIISPKAALVTPPPSLFLELTQHNGEIDTPYGNIRYSFDDEVSIKKGGNIIQIDVTDYLSPPQTPLLLELALPDLKETIVPLGLKGKKEIRKILREKQLSDSEKRLVPLLKIGDIPLWLMPYTRTEALLINNSTTKVLTIKFSPNTTLLSSKGEGYNNKNANFE